MAKRRDALERKPPTISLQEGKRRLTIMRDKAKGMLSARPLSESAVQTWDNTALDYIKQTFGEDSAHIYTFIGQPRIRISDGYSDEDYDVYAEREDAERLDAKVKVLDSLVEQIDTELSFAAPAVSLQQEDFWSRLYPSVTQVAKARFDASHYADAVEAAFKELNSKVKAYMKRATGQEFDGADLMQRAFSPNAPVVRLADLSTEDGKSIQQGYMQIFAGSMTGIRNPKAHSNITIDAPRAIHFCIWQVCFMPCLMSDYETSTKAKQNQDPFRWSQLTGVLGAKAFPLRPSRNQLVSKTTNSPGRKCARTKLIYCIITYLKNKLSK